MEARIGSSIMERNGLRLTLGTMFIAHAALKYYVFTLPGTAQFFPLRLPAVLAYITQTLLRDGSYAVVNAPRARKLRQRFA
jgi:putative oxidoreductase